MFQLIEGLVRDQTVERCKVSGATFRMWILLNPQKEKKLNRKYVTSRLDDDTLVLMSHHIRGGRC